MTRTALIRGGFGIAALVLAAGPAHARVGRCLLQVDGRTFIDGPCNITISEGGSFTIGTGERRRSRYFAYVDMERGGARGYWNETPDATHAHSDLGFLRREGACWRNRRARVCAFR